MLCQKASVSAAGSDFHKLVALCIPEFIKDHTAANSLSQLKDQINLWLFSQGLSSGASISAKRSRDVGGHMCGFTHKLLSRRCCLNALGCPSQGPEDHIHAWQGLRSQQEAPLLRNGHGSLWEGVFHGEREYFKVVEMAGVEALGTSIALCSVLQLWGPARCRFSTGFALLFWVFLM